MITGGGMPPHWPNQWTHQRAHPGGGGMRRKQRRSCHSQSLGIQLNFEGCNGGHPAARFPTLVSQLGIKSVTVPAVQGMFEFQLHFFHFCSKVFVKFSKTLLQVLVFRIQ